MKRIFWTILSFVSTLSISCTTQKTKNSEVASNAPTLQTTANSNTQKTKTKITEHESKFQKYFSVHTQKQHAREMALIEEQREQLEELRAKSLRAQKEASSAKNLSTASNEANASEPASPSAPSAESKPVTVSNIAPKVNVEPKN